MIRMTIEELKKLAKQMENRQEYGSMKGYANISISKHPNGKEFIEFEQPCNYAECVGNYYRFEGDK